MAGGHGSFHPVKLDPAIERWSAMRENVYETFKFTPKTTRIVLMMCGVVPVATYYLCREFNMKYDLVAPPRGQSLLRKPPPATSQPNEG